MALNLPGVFTSRSDNGYLFAEADPVNRADPTGQTANEYAIFAGKISVPLITPIAVEAGTTILKGAVVGGVIGVLGTEIKKELDCQKIKSDCAEDCILKHGGESGGTNFQYDFYECYRACVEAAGC